MLCCCAWSCWEARCCPRGSVELTDVSSPSHLCCRSDKQAALWEHVQSFRHGAALSIHAVYLITLGVIKMWDDASSASVPSLAAVAPLASPCLESEEDSWVHQGKQVLADVETSRFGSWGSLGGDAEADPCIQVSFPPGVSHPLPTAGIFPLSLGCPCLPWPAVGIHRLLVSQAGRLLGTALEGSGNGC